MTQLYIHTFFSIPVYHRMLNIVPCALFCGHKFASADPQIPIHPCPTTLPLGNH